MHSGLGMQRALMDSVGDGVQAPEELSACLNARGLYNSMQFVLRLSPVVHDLVDQVVSGQAPVTWEGLQAYSTYLHETVHWWQHIGSTTGLVMSMCYPAQAHANLDHLSFLVSNGKANKGIKTWAENQLRSGIDHSDEVVKNANIAVNNAMDIEFYKALILRPKLAKEIVKDPYFESVGHSFQSTYTSVLSVLSATCDRELEFLPDPREWEKPFLQMSNAKVEGYYHGSPIGLPPVGVLDILEGQARFIQLQFLSFAANEHLTLSELSEEGYLEGVYYSAFDAYLRLTDTTAPETINDPAVGLFLLVCDMAINPTAGFPLEIREFDRFIESVDPGHRFAQLCLAIRDDHPELKREIVNYSKEEYLRLSAILANACGLEDPIQGLKQVATWVQSAPSVAGLLQEKESFRYEFGNLPIRVVFSHFVSFCVDKLQRPEFFCWAGAWMIGPRSDEVVRRLWMTNLSLFSDKADDDGVFPREFPDKDPVALQTTFNVFFANNVLYDLTRQWILQDGPFRYEFDWLSKRHSKEQLADWAKESFEHLHGISPDGIVSDYRVPSSRPEAD